MTTQSFSALQYAYIHAYIVCISPCIQASGWGLYREPLVIPTPSAQTNTDYKEIGTNESKHNSQDRLRGEKTGTDSAQPCKQRRPDSQRGRWVTDIHLKQQR